MKTRLILSGIAALLMAPLAAQAADLPQPSYKAQPGLVAPAYASWTGFYVGINGGYGFGSSSWTDPAISLKPKGGLVGATAGYNFQTGTWVWGIETDLDWSGMKGSVDCGGGTCSTSANWLGTTRFRLGYGGWGNWLPYATVGAAYGGLKADSPGGSTSKTQIGWTAGLGLEYAFSGAWSAKIEYLYIDLADRAYSVTGVNNGMESNVLRVGVNYRF
jgi:outer membrane immunogenic protein